MENASVLVIICYHCGVFITARTSGKKYQVTVISCECHSSVQCQRF